jgi:hypothetical protein
MEQGYHLNIAIVLPERAWDSTPNAPVYRSTHYARVFLSDGPREPAIVKAREIAARFPAGDKPGQFHCTLTEWTSRGTSIPLDGKATAFHAGFRLERGNPIVHRGGDTYHFAYTADDGRIATQESGQNCRLWLPDAFDGVEVRRV